MCREIKNDSKNIFIYVIVLSHIVSSTTSIGQRKTLPINVFRTLQRLEIAQKDFRRDIGLFPVWEMKKMARAARLQTWRTVESHRRCHGIRFRRQRTSNFPSIQCVGSRILKNEMWKMLNSLQRWFVECRAFISHNESSPPSRYFTEQSRIGVMNWLSRFLVSHFQAFKKSIAKVNEQLNHKWSEYFD